MTTTNPPSSALNAAREIPHETVDRVRKTLREMSLISVYSGTTCRLLGGLANGLDRAALQMQADDELGEPKHSQSYAGAGESESARPNAIIEKVIADEQNAMLARIGKIAAAATLHQQVSVDEVDLRSLLAMALTPRVASTGSL